MRKIIIIFFIVLIIPVIFSVDLYFYQTDIRDALNQLAMQEEVSILYDPQVSGFISIEAYDLSMEKALDLILLPLGYYWSKIDNIYFVGTANPDSSSFNLISKKYIINLKYITIEDIINAIPKVMTNYIYKTPNKNQVLIYAPPKIASQIAETITLIDKPTLVAEIEVKIMEVDENTFKKYGIVWSNDNSGRISYSNNGVQIDLALIDGGLDFIMDTLTSNGDAKIISQGVLKLKSGSTAQISGYTTIGFIVDNESSKYIERRINTQVIMSGNVFLNHVSLTINSVVESFIQDSSKITPVGASLKTNLDIKYGKPYYIAGLSFDTVSEMEKGIPGLKDIPIIGNLFKSKSYSLQKKNIIIFIEARMAGDKEWEKYY